MKRFLVIGAAALAAFLFSRQAKAAENNPFFSYEGDGTEPVDEYLNPFFSYEGDASAPVDDYINPFFEYQGDGSAPVNDYGNPFFSYEGDGSLPSAEYDPYDFQGEQIMSNEQRLNAFLFMIRSSEHAYPRDVLNNACYNIFYGGSYFENMIDHPVITGEKVGVPLPAAMCRASGYASGKCASTAAGAYQIIKPTWNSIRAIAPRLPDFLPASQDEAARRLLAQCGALPLIYAGDIAGAIQKASKLWASLPGSTAQQNPKSLSFALARFDEGLGVA